MGTEGQGPVQRQAKDLRVSNEREELTIKENLRMVTSLMRVRCEKGNAGFFCRDGQVLPLGPSRDCRQVAIELSIDLVKIDAGFQNCKVIRVAERQLRNIREISDEEVKENGRNNAPLRDPIVDLFEG